MKKKFKAILSFVLAAAVLLGTIPAYGLEVSAAEVGQSESYTQLFDKATTIKALGEGSSAELAVVNKSTGEWEHSPSGKALSITANKTDVRTHLLDFGDGVAAANAVSEELSGDVTDGDQERDVTSGNAVVLAAGNPGLADGIYEISMRTGDKLYGSVGFLARYKDENHYAGISIDFQSENNYLWECHYSTSVENLRHNIGFSNSSAMTSLKANTDYFIQLKYEGPVISCQIKEQGSSDFIDLGSYTMSKDGFYTGEGGLAIRINPGNVGGNNVIIDNIVQKDIDGKEIKTMNFDSESATEPTYEAYINKGKASDRSLSTLAIVDIPKSNSVVGFENDKTLNKLSGTGLFVDEASPEEAATGIYTVKTNGTVNNYGLVFQYKDENNYAAVRFDGTKWVVEGRNAGAAIEGITLSNQPAALMADKAHTLVLDYSDLAKVTLKVDDNEAVELGDLSAVVPDTGKVGFILGEDGVLYADAISLKYNNGGGRL